jgi:hypothetical protein
VGVVRQLAVFFQHLRRITARPAVNPVQLLTAVAAARTIATPTPTVVVIVAVATVIVVQG